MNRLAIAIVAALMMGSSLPTLKYRALSSAGVPLSGAKLYFYETGTTTPLATYSDEALSVANANPVVADSYGWFGEIYLKTTQAYRVKLTTSAGVAQWTLDDVWAAQLTSSAFQTRIKQIASNPLDYGAVGDGVADESTYVQSAIDNATRVVDLLGKTYRCDSTISIPSNRSIVNGTLDFTNNSNANYITAYGLIDNAIPLSVDVTAGDTSITPDVATGFAVDDWIYVESSEAWSSAGTATSGEMFQITAIAGGALYLDHPTLLSYTAADAAGVYLITPVDNVELVNLKILASSVAAGTGNIVSAGRVTNLRIQDVVVDGPKGSVVKLEYAAKVDIRNLATRGGADTTSYGLRLMEAVWQVAIRDSVLSGLECGVESDVDTTGSDGLQIDVLVENNRFDDVDQPIYITPTTWDLRVIDNVITNTVAAGGKPGMSLRSGLMEIRGNSIYDVDDEGMEVFYSVATDPDRSSISICDNLIYDSGGEGIYVKATTSAAGVLDALTIERNTIASPGGYGIALTEYLHDQIRINWNEITDTDTKAIYVTDATGASSNIDLQIVGNRIAADAVAANAIDLSGFAAGSMDALQIRDNVITGSFAIGILVDNDGATPAAVVGLVVSGNTIIGDAVASTTHGIRLDGIDGPSIAVRNNTLDNIDGNGAGIYYLANINVGTTPSLDVSGNKINGTYNGIQAVLTSEALTETNISGNTIVADQGIVLTATTSSDDIVISNNVLSGTTGATTYVAQITGIASEISITGNTFSRGDDLAHNILLSGTGAGNITNVNITGNVFENGDYAVGEGTDANTTNVLLSNNQFVGLSTFGAEYGVVLRSNVPNAMGAYFFQATSTGNVTGPTDGSSDPVVFDTELHDYGNVHNAGTGTFTAPVGGLYLFSSSVRLESEATENIDEGFVAFDSTDNACMDVYEMFGGTEDNPTDNLEDVFTRTQFCILAAGNLVNVVVYCGGAGADCTINAGSTFSGVLLQ